MNSTAIIALYAIRFGIPAAKELASLFAKPEPTDADWNKVWSLSDKSYDDYLNEAAARLDTVGITPGEPSVNDPNMPIAVIPPVA